MIRNSKLRVLVAVVLGATASASLCLSVLPLVMFQARIGDESTLAYLLSRFLPYLALIWAVGGWAVSRAGTTLAGGITLGIAGLASSLFLVAMALQPAPKILVVGGLTGLVYGFLGGLLLARLVAAPPVDGMDEA